MLIRLLNKFLNEFLSILCFSFKILESDNLHFDIRHDYNHSIIE
ncbi:hypothetical protein NJ7G_1845 [Natrinema sp. J7-2]|nr:hypothetical protein NJ7G_1845 [Natrinema sp. J7-2]